MVLTRRKLFWADAVLLLIAFFIANYLKRGSVTLPEGYVNLLYLFYACWLLASLVAKKFQPRRYDQYWSGIILIFKSNCYLTYIISFAIVFFSLSNYSRIQVFTTCVALFLLNMIVWSVARIWVLEKPERHRDASEPLPNAFSSSRTDYRRTTTDPILQPGRGPCLSLW